MKEMQFKEPKMYWDGANRKYTAEKTDTPVYKGEKEDIYIETWSSSENYIDRLNFAFSQIEKDNGLVWQLRESHFKRHNFRAFGTIRMILPPSFFDEMYKRFVE